MHWNLAPERRAVLVAILFLVGLLGFGMWFVWQPKDAPTASSAVSKKESCPGQFGQSLAKKYRLQPLQYCVVEDYTTNTHEKIRYVEIAYGTGSGCKISCYNKGKQFFVKSSGQVIKGIDMTYADLDLSLGSDDPDCKEVWSNDLTTMIHIDPDHLKRTIIQVGKEYRWQITLTDYNGYPPNSSTPVTCLRTGVLTTDLAGNDVQVVGTPIVTN